MFYSQTTRGFYVTEIHGDNIPSDAVEISIEQHAALLQAQSNGATIAPDENGYPIAVDPAAPTLADLKKSKLAAINVAFEASLAPYQSAYPQTEKFTWEQQRTESAAWAAWDAAGRAGDEPATPTLDGIATARGMDREELIAKANTKALLFAQVANAAIGKRQALEDAITAAGDQAALDAIAW